MNIAQTHLRNRDDNGKPNSKGECRQKRLLRRASYITRMSALDPEGRDRARSDTEERSEQLSLLTHDHEKTEPSVTETLRDNLHHRSLDAEKEHGGGQRDADPVWTWNVRIT